MDKNELLAKLDVVLKDMHPSNMPVKTLAIKAIDALCEPEKKTEYTVMIDKGDESYFDRYEAMEILGIFSMIFSNLGLEVGVSYGGGPEGDYLGIKMAA